MPNIASPVIEISYNIERCFSVNQFLIYYILIQIIMNNFFP